MDAKAGKSRKGEKRRRTGHGGEQIIPFFAAFAIEKALSLSRRRRRRSPSNNNNNRRLSLNRKDSPKRDSASYALFRACLRCLCIPFSRFALEIRPPRNVPQILSLFFLSFFAARKQAWSSTLIILLLLERRRRRCESSLDRIEEEGEGKWPR